MSPLISVIMPSYNSDRFIQKSIDSILNQTLQDFEFIIIDNLSKDKTWGIIQEYVLKDSRIIALQNDEPISIASTLNKGIELAKGLYIARMDSDDISLPERFQKQIDYLRSNPATALIGCGVEFIDENDNKYKYAPNQSYTKQEVDKVMLFPSIVLHPSWMIKKDIINEIGLYRDLSMAEDLDVLLRVLSSGYKIDNIPDITFQYRKWINNISKTNGLQDVKAGNYAKKMYIERIMRGKDSFSKQNYEKYIHTNRLAEWFYKKSQECMFKATLIREKNGNKFIMRFYHLMSCVLAPSKLKAAAYFILAKLLIRK